MLSKLGDFKRAPWIWALMSLSVILLFNLCFSPGFFEVTVRDGNVYGSLIDVVNRAAPVMLVALGMTLVIATGGIDLSVGATMAIVGSVAAEMVVKAQASLL